MFDRGRGVKCNGTGIIVGILSGLKAYMQSVGKTALQAILGAGTSEVVKELLTLMLRKG